MAPIRLIHPSLLSTIKGDKTLMLPTQESALKPYSLGVVAVTKARGSDEIEVTPIEEVSTVDGSLKDYQKDYSVSLSNVNATPTSATAKAKATIKAKWLAPGGSNRYTAPDVVAGERVLLYRYADSETYYWETIGHHPTIRRLETVRYVFSNQEGGNATVDESSSYWIEVSTHDQHVTLKTSNNRGEKSVYSVVIDAKNGTVTVNDAEGNTLLLDTVEGVASLVGVKRAELHAQGSSVVVDGASNVITLTSGTVTVNAAGGSFTANSSGGVKVTGQNVEIQSQSIHLNASSITSSVPIVTSG